jgi:hypothetical protein
MLHYNYNNKLSDDSNANINNLKYSVKYSDIVIQNNDDMVNINLDGYFSFIFKKSSIVIANKKITFSDISFIDLLYVNEMLLCNNKIVTDNFIINNGYKNNDIKVTNVNSEINLVSKIIYSNKIHCGNIISNDVICDKIEAFYDLNIVSKNEINFIAKDINIGNSSSTIYLYEVKNNNYSNTNTTIYSKQYILNKYSLGCNIYTIDKGNLTGMNIGYNISIKSSNDAKQIEIKMNEHKFTILQLSINGNIVNFINNFVCDNAVMDETVSTKCQVNKLYYSNFKANTIISSDIKAQDITVIGSLKVDNIILKYIQLNIGLYIAENIISNSIKTNNVNIINLLCKKIIYSDKNIYSNQITVDSLLSSYIYTNQIQYDKCTIKNILSTRKIQSYKIKGNELSVNSKLYINDFIVRKLNILICLKIKNILSNKNTISNINVDKILDLKLFISNCNIISNKLIVFDIINLDKLALGNNKIANISNKMNIFTKSIHCNDINIIDNIIKKSFIKLIKIYIKKLPIIFDTKVKFISEKKMSVINCNTLDIKNKKYDNVKYNKINLHTNNLSLNPLSENQTEIYANSVSTDYLYINKCNISSKKSIDINAKKHIIINNCFLQFRRLNLYYLNKKIIDNESSKIISIKHKINPLSITDNIKIKNISADKLYSNNLIMDKCNSKNLYYKTILVRNNCIIRKKISLDNLYLDNEKYNNVINNELSSNKFVKEYKINRINVDNLSFENINFNNVTIDNIINDNKFISDIFISNELTVNDLIIDTLLCNNNSFSSIKSSNIYCSYLDTNTFISTKTIFSKNKISVNNLINKSIINLQSSDIICSRIYCINLYSPSFNVNNLIVTDINIDNVVIDSFNYDIVSDEIKSNYINTDSIVPNECKIYNINILELISDNFSVENDNICNFDSILSSEIETDNLTINNIHNYTDKIPVFDSIKDANKVLNYRQLYRIKDQLLVCLKLQY